MKSSNIILLVAGIVFLASLTAYNFSVKNEYLRVNYKDPFYEYSKLKFKDFDKIEIKAGNLVDLKIVQKPEFDFRVNKRLEDDFLITQTGSTISIGIKDSTKRSYYYPKSIVIFCPYLKELKVDAQMTLNNNGDGKEVPGYLYQGDRQIVLEGFSLDSLSVVQGIFNTVKLSRNKIGRLVAITGGKVNGGSKLVVGADNEIRSANFSISNHNQLSLKGGRIDDLQLNPADSASVELQGNALSLLK